MDAGLPFLKEQGMKAMAPANSSLAEAVLRVESIRDFYRGRYPGVYSEKKQSVDRSIEHLKEIAGLTTFPHMGVTWQTHPDNLGHTEWPGCFRCHGKLAPKGGGKPLDASCTLCHDFAPQ